MMSNTSKIACRICVADRGLNFNAVYLFDTQEELNDHLEAVHHKPVIWKGESKEDAIKRFLKKYPEAKDCKVCNQAGAEWGRIESQFKTNVID